MRRSRVHVRGGRCARAQGWGHGRLCRGRRQYRERSEILGTGVALARTCRLVGVGGPWFGLREYLLDSVFDQLDVPARFPDLDDTVTMPADEVTRAMSLQST